MDIAEQIEAPAFVYDLFSTPQSIHFKSTGTKAPAGAQLSICFISADTGLLIKGHIDVAERVFHGRSGKYGDGLVLNMSERDAPHHLR